MSSVYKAHDRLLDRQIAVKILHPHFTEDEEYVERFRREARSVAQLSHPNIVTVIDRGEDEGRQYIVFEYVEGENLKQLLERTGPMPVRRSARAGPADGPRAVVCARARTDPPGREAAERPAERGRAGEDDRLRDRTLGRRPGRDDHRHRARDERVHRARAGARAAGRRADGRLLARGRPLRAAGRRRAVRGRDVRHRGAEARERADAERARPPARPSSSGGAGGGAGDGEVARRSLRVHGRVRRRAGGLPRRARSERRAGDDDLAAAGGSDSEPREPRRRKRRLGVSLADRRGAGRARRRRAGGAWRAGASGRRRRSAGGAPTPDRADRHLGSTIPTATTPSTTTRPASRPTATSRRSGRQRATARAWASRVSGSSWTPAKPSNRRR